MPVDKFFSSLFGFVEDTTAHLLVFLIVRCEIWKVMIFFSQKKYVCGVSEKETTKLIDTDSAQKKMSGISLASTAILR